MKERKVNLIVFSVSGPSWQPVKDGKPYNKYVGTVVFRQRLFGVLVKRTLTIADDNYEDVDKKLHMIWQKQNVEIKTSKLDPMPTIGGKHANTNR